MTGQGVQSAADAAAWTVVVPVKSLSAAKTRLAPEHSPAERAALARAFALDTIEAARAARRVRRVVVVSDEPAIEHALRGLPGVDVVPEPAARGLGAAIAHGIAVAAQRPPVTTVDVGLRLVQPASRAHTGNGGGVAVLLGDVPSVRSEDLDAALEAAARHPLAFVPDAEDTGTTLATARAGEPFEAHFGRDSAARHAAAGFADLAAAHPDAIAARLRRDVDTAAELRAVVALGVGPHTSAALRALDLAEGPAPRHPLDPSTAPPGADRKAAS
ncbi:NTP transferase domain-containing protein [Agromyces aurantiacus]|uniref:Phosphoenolpyruvate guanylyltransferase n=1 Tax=Agromyces aurantiacus TaxID=165814 RepID=A0ABV9R289_9MICO|nr:NTP transferase domain-containing protein [Agromyces aurantiacus]MBM7502628.1 2-phospho-L-lactate guanylyltransferase [Agromyces aurantiacus]